MSALEISLGKRVTATVAAWAAYGAAAVLFRLPDGAVAALVRTTRLFVREPKTRRMLADLGEAFARGGREAVALRRIATESRAGDIVAIVRGAVIRALR